MSEDSFGNEFGVGGVDGEAPPDYSQILKRGIGATERHAFDRLHSPAGSDLYMVANALAHRLNESDAWVERVVMLAKKVNVKKNPRVRVALGAYAEGSHPIHAVVRALNELGISLSENDLFHLANHNRPMISRARKPLSETYPLNSFPEAIFIRSFGEATYRKVEALYYRRLRELEANMEGRAPRTAAKEALEWALERAHVPMEVSAN